MNVVGCAVAVGSSGFGGVEANRLVARAVRVGESVKRELNEE